ncbi:2-oxoglutarate carboxylase small subunit [Peptococcaceae bacterium CEB3]|nr:2-oxoglutarate carboxylase small subunit [Peptococcaceae bacterium CEB3]
MFKKILIANRGEIALRVIRAASELGIRPVAIYTEPDENSLHVQKAAEAYSVGGIKGYLDMERILAVAQAHSIEAIHPGYGFLAENAEFARLCQQNGIQFIGPTATAIETMGDKVLAKKSLAEAGVKVITGSDGVLWDEAEACLIAEKIGYPVLVKAAAGGGGRGMRVAYNEDELIKGFRAATSEAKAAFGNGAIYLEKFLENPRHVEIQILADNYGKVIYLGERECSIQRRHQKLLEEAPSPAVTEELRRQMGKVAVKAAKAVGYTGAGTLEFLLDKRQQFYFMEMNTRIQVEHAVTELVTGIDLVKEQIRVAAGEPLRYRQEDVKIRGWAIECRLNAEDPCRDFMPSPGTITDYHQPGGFGLRVDSIAHSGYTILPYYDSMIGKLIAWGENRDEAINRMYRTLDEFTIGGIATTIPFHKTVLQHPAFRAGDIDTDFIARYGIIGLISQKVPVDDDGSSNYRTFRLKINDLYWEVDVADC